MEAGIDSQQPELVGEVAQLPGQRVLTAIYRAGIHKGSERVDLVANGDVAPGARWAGAEERDAVLLVPDSRVIRWDLQHRERLAWLLWRVAVGMHGLYHARENSDSSSMQRASQGPYGISGPQLAEILRFRGDKEYIEWNTEMPLGFGEASPLTFLHLAS